VSLQGGVSEPQALDRTRRIDAVGLRREVDRFYRLYAGDTET